MPGQLDITDLSKSYAGVQALLHVSISISAGSVHAICGENGAGKSTLIKCLSGNVIPDSGTVHFDGCPMKFGQAGGNRDSGIVVIHQESTIFPHLNTIENIFVGREKKWMKWFLDHPSMNLVANEWMEKLGQSFDITIPTESLSHAERQMVAMARALSGQCRVLILDEPTASLSPRESRVLLEIVSKLKRDGVTIIYISHRLDEVLEIADAITVLRDGRHIETSEASQFGSERLIQLMVGRELELTRRRGLSSPDEPSGNPVLEVQSLSRFGVFNDISFSLMPGEVTGLSGLVGAGRSELARSIIGIDSLDSGTVLLDGEEVRFSNPGQSLSRGVVMVPEDRQHEGLVLLSSITDNLNMAVENHPDHQSILINHEMRASTLDLYLNQLGIKIGEPDDQVQTLSGGNQQKVVIAKWLATHPRVLILDEPTRGVDVGAKAQVHKIIGDLAESGLAILVISSDLPEIIHVSDRVLVMREGEISGDFQREAINPETIMAAAFPDGGQKQSSINASTGGGP